MRADHFAYPKALPASGAVEDEVRARFRSAAVAGTVPNRFGHTDPYRLARSPIQVGDPGWAFRRKARGGMRLEDDLRSQAQPPPLRRPDDLTDVTPRLVHITTSDISLELLLGPELRAFRDAGYEVHTASQTGPYVAGLEADGIVHHTLAHSTRAMAPTHDVRAIGEVRRLLVELRPDIVHTHNPKSGIFGRLGAKWARVPVIINTVHGLYAQPEDRFAKRAVVYGLERLASTCSDVELVVSPEDVEVLRRLRIPAGKIELPGNGVDLARFSPERPGADAIRREVRDELGFGPDDVVCGAVGRLVVEKGFRELIDAAERLRSSHPRLRFVIVGPEDPSKADALTPADLARAAEAGIVLTGARSDMDRLYLAMDLFVLPSWREGFPGRRWRRWRPASR